MDSSLFYGNVIVQGITGTHGAFHTRQMVAAGTNVVAGTSPTKAGTDLDGIPVYSSIADIQKDFTVDISVIFVPAPYAKDAIIEAIRAGIKLIVCITEGIPVHDMLDARAEAIRAGVTIIGPNCPGATVPGVAKLGIIPESFTSPGTVAIVSRSGTLTYEIAASLTRVGVGQKYIVGIGGDRVRGVNFVQCLKLFQQDQDVDRIVLVGEIGGHDEQRAAEYIADHITKPVFSYIAGHGAPLGVQLGHAGAILGNEDESADAKSRALTKAGARVYSSVRELVQAML